MARVTSRNNRTRAQACCQPCRAPQVVLNLIEVVVLSTKHSLPCLAYTRREANYPKAQYSRGVPRNFPKGGLPGDLPRAHLDIAQRPSNVGAHPQTQPLSNSGTVLLETICTGYAPTTYSLTREEHAPNTAPPAPTATDTGVWPQPEPQLIQLKLSY